MRTYTINNSWNEHTIVYFTNNKKAIATQTSVNRRLKSIKKHGLTLFGKGFWTIETDEEIKQRLERQYSKPIIFG